MADRVVPRKTGKVTSTPSPQAKPEPKKKLINSKNSNSSRTSNQMTATKTLAGTVGKLSQLNHFIETRVTTKTFHNAGKTLLRSNEPSKVRKVSPIKKMEDILAKNSNSPKFAMKMVSMALKFGVAAGVLKKAGKQYELKRKTKKTNAEVIKEEQRKLNINFTAGSITAH